MSNNSTHRVLSATFEVGRRVRWWFPLFVLLACALGDISADFAAQLLTYFLILIVLLVALGLMGVNPFSPKSVLKSMFYFPGWRALGIVVFLIGLALGLAIAGRWVSDASAWLAEATDGDVNLFTALLVAAAGCAFAWVSFAILGVWPSDDAVKLGRWRREWRAMAASVTLAVVALVPAALLANWAWNILASVMLPLLVLSIGHAIEVADLKKGLVRDAS